MTEQIKYRFFTVNTAYILKLSFEEHSESASFQHGEWDGRIVWHVWYRRELHTTLIEVFLNLTEVFLTLTEVYPCFFLSWKANARVKLAKTGHGLHSSKFVVICVVLCIVCVWMCTVLLPPGDKPIAVKYTLSQHILCHISYHIISYHIISYHIIS